MQTTEQYTLPAGTYFVGDPCYCFEDNERWMTLLEKADYFKSKNVLQFEGKHYVAAFSTMYGDGEYNGFAVDAGLLGCVHESLIDCKIGEFLGRMVTFNAPFMVCAYSDGTICIGDIEIFTGDSPVEEEFYDSYWPEDYEEDGEEN